MIAHDDSLDCYVGQIIEQGSKWANMGTKGNATGVHCHIQISQSKDTTWKKNSYGNYCFNNEYDTDACYFVDDTNIINGLGGNWKKTTDVKVNQILFKGSKVKFNGVFKVDIIKSPIASNLFGCTKITGCTFQDYKAGRAKDYHWIPTKPFIECEKNGTITKDQKLIHGTIYV